MLSAVRKRFWHLGLMSCYWYALLIGLMPAPLHFRSGKLRQSWIYLAYSAIVHVLGLAAIPLAFPTTLYKTSYLSSKEVLQWLYTISVSCKVIAFVVIIQITWCKRQRLLEWCNAYMDFLKQLRLYSGSNAHSTAALTVHLQHLLLFKLLTGARFVLLTVAIFFNMNKSYDGSQHSYALMMLINFIANTLLMTSTLQLAYALCQLRCQFVFINTALRDVQVQMQQLGRGRVSAQLSRSLANRLTALCGLHLRCHRLTWQAFRLFEAPFATIWLRTFVACIDMIYHMIQFLTRQIPADVPSNMNGLTLVVVFFSDFMLIVSIVEGVVTECNQTGTLLRGYGGLPFLHRQEKVMREVAIFCNYLKCNPLRYRICGLFEFNKGESLRHMLTAFINVTVLMQFDLKMR